MVAYTLRRVEDRAGAPYKLVLTRTSLSHICIHRSNAAPCARNPADETLEAAIALLVDAFYDRAPLLYPLLPLISVLIPTHG